MTDDDLEKDRGNHLTVNWEVGYEDAFAEEDIFLEE